MTYQEEFSDLKDWCHHEWVSLITWRCPDCDRALNEQAKKRLLSAPIVAPQGRIWLLHKHSQPDFMTGTEDDFGIPWVFTDRTRIAKHFIRDAVIGAESLRNILGQIHWYQCVYNECKFDGWDEADFIKHPQQYELYLERIDCAG